MNVTLLILQSQQWIDYCKARMGPSAPCRIPPGVDPTKSIVTILCVIFSAVILVSAIFHFLVRLRIGTAAEFDKANDRLLASTPLLASLKGKYLRQHCKTVSRDLIQVTGFAGKRASLCLHEHYASYDRDRIRSIFNFINENKDLRFDAVLIRVIYYVPFFTNLMARKTKATVHHYATGWRALFEQYTTENPEC
jgi:hypothetical protein